MILELLAAVSAAYAPMNDWHTGQPCPIPVKGSVSPDPREYRRHVYSVESIHGVAPAVIERCLDMRQAAIDRENRRRAATRKRR